MSDDSGLEPGEEQKELITQLGLDMSDDEVEVDELENDEKKKRESDAKERGVKGSDVEKSVVKSEMEVLTEEEPAPKKEVFPDEEKGKVEKEEGELTDEDDEQPEKPEKVRTYAPMLPVSKEWAKKMINLKNERFVGNFRNSAERPAKEESSHRRHVENYGRSQGRSRSRSRETCRDEDRAGGRREERPEQDYRGDAARHREENGRRNFENGRERRNNHDDRRRYESRAHNYHENRRYSPQRYPINDHRNGHGRHRDQRGYDDRDNNGRAFEYEARDSGNGRYRSNNHRRDNSSNYSDKKTNKSANKVRDLTNETHSKFSQRKSLVWEPNIHPSRELHVKAPSSSAAPIPTEMEVLDSAAQRKNTNSTSQSHLVTSDITRLPDFLELHTARELITSTKVISGLTLLTPPTPSPAHSNPHITEITPTEENVLCNKEDEITLDSSKPSDIETETSANTTMQTGGGKSLGDMMNGTEETVGKKHEEKETEGTEQKVRMAFAHRQFPTADSPILLSPPVTPITSPHAPLTPQTENTVAAPTSVPGVTPLMSFKIPKKTRVAGPVVTSEKLVRRAEPRPIEATGSAGKRRNNQTNSRPSSSSTQHHQRYGTLSHSISNSRSTNDMRSQNEKKTTKLVLEPISEKALANPRLVREDTEKWKLKIRPDSTRVAYGPNKAAKSKKKKILQPKEPEHGEPPLRKAHTTNSSHSDRMREQLNATAVTLAEKITKNSRKRTSEKAAFQDYTKDRNGNRKTLNALELSAPQSKKYLCAAAKKIRAAPVTSGGISASLSAILDDACKTVCKTVVKESPEKVAEQKFEEILCMRGLKVGTVIENGNNPGQFMKLISSEDFKDYFSMFYTFFSTFRDKIESHDFDSVESFCKAFIKFINKFIKYNSEDVQIQQKCRFLRILYDIHFPQC